MSVLMRMEVGIMRALMFASVASMVDLFNRDNMDMLEELGCKVDVAANFTEGSVYSKEQADAFAIEMKKAGREVIDVPIPRSMYNIKDMVKTIKILRKHMSVKHYDIVHCQSPIGGVLCRIACAPYRKEGMKVLYYAHGFHFFKGADLFYWLVFYNIEKLCAHLTDCLITLNKEDYTRAAENFKTEVCYMKGVGLDLQEIYDVPVDRNGVRKELGLSEDTKIIVSVSELSRRKNCMTCLQAFAKAGRNDAVLLFLGIGEQMDMLKEEAKKLGVSDKVIFAGFRNDVIRIMKASDVYIFSSKQEGLPVSLMQAMACKLPVLVSRIRGNTDLIENKKQGFMFSYDNSDAYAKGINKLLDNPKLCKRMGDVNGEVIKGYDKEPVNKMMKDLYIKLLHS